jgi:hypothetical protein
MRTARLQLKLTGCASVPHVRRRSGVDVAVV